MSYPGGKSGAGVYQRLINQIPPHTVYIETHLGGGAIFRLKKPAQKSIGIDLDPAVIARWQPHATPAATFVCTDALLWLQSYQFEGSEFIYCDPPYLMSTRRGGKLYRHEYTDAQHRELLAVLKTLPCPVMISGYPSPLYDDLLPGWRRLTFSAMTRGATLATEQLWMNYPQPRQLQDYQYVGDNYRSRELLTRKRKRWAAKLKKMPDIERLALVSALGEPQLAPPQTAVNNTSRLVLSLFPGIDLLAKPFEQRGFCVVRGPDLLFGGDIRAFKAPPGVFEGVIAGPPCQEFSALHRTPKTGYSRAMLDELIRVVATAQPAWWLVENVAGVPDLKIPGYTWQRFELDLAWYSEYSRLRHIQFGSRAGFLLDPPKLPKNPVKGSAVLATDERSWEEIKHIQGLPADFDLPDMSLSGKKKAVGNAVPIRLAQVLAELIDVQVYAGKKTASLRQTLDPAAAEHPYRRCLCACGRRVFGKADYYSPACRKRAQRRRVRLGFPNRDS